MLSDIPVRLHLYYDNVIYGQCLDSVDVKRIQMLQNLWCKTYYRISHRLRDIGWPRLYMTCFFYELLKTGVPPYLLEKITYIPSLNIRKKTFQSAPKFKKDLLKRSFSFTLACVVNNLGLEDFSAPYGTIAECMRGRLMVLQ